MALHKTYIVMPIYNEGMYKATRTNFGFNKWSVKEDNPNYGIFFDKGEAINFAKNQTAINGGVELMICESVMQFFSKPSPVQTKVWKGEELVVEGKA